MTNIVNHSLERLEPATPTVIEVCWLAPELLLVIAVGELGTETASGRVMTARAGPAGTELPSRWISWPSTTTADASTVLTMIRVPAEISASELTIEPASFLGPDATVWVGESIPDLQAVIRGHLAGLPSTLREQVLAFVNESAAELEAPRSRLWSAGLHRLREALRERRPVAVMAPESPHVVHVDYLIRLDEGSFLVTGWLRDIDGRPSVLRAVSPEGGTVDLIDDVCLYPRPDLAGLFGGGHARAEAAGVGFTCRFDLRRASEMVDGWIVEMTGASGGHVEDTAPRVMVDLDESLDRVMEQLWHERLPESTLRSEHIRPAVSALLRRRRAEATIGRVASYGVLPERPVTSFIIPLYGRIDLLEHQLAQFAADPELQQAELVYVLDSPEFDGPLSELSPRLHEIYGVPFRTVSLERNGGFSNATNVGAGMASGDLLLLMNSDVIPKQPGWLSKMIHAYRASDDVGALGPKLLFEDDTLQHAGMYFVELPDPGMWDNRHCFKGLDSALPAANVARSVPAVTAACLLIDRRLFREMGGLSGEYIQGDYEDSDLCLRLARAGRTTRYEPSVELYHLEGQSYPTSTRQRNGEYNRWLHADMWGSDIRAIMQRFEIVPCSRGRG